MKLHISGPMSGIKDLNRPAFNRLAGILLDMGHSTFNPATDVDVDGKSYRQMLDQNLAWICEEAEGMVLLPLAHRSPGSRAERAVAEAIGLPVWVWARSVSIGDAEFVPANAAADRMQSAQSDIN